MDLIGCGCSWSRPKKSMRKSWNRWVSHGESPLGRGCGDEIECDEIRDIAHSPVNPVSHHSNSDVHACVGAFGADQGSGRDTTLEGVFECYKVYSFHGFVALPFFALFFT